MSTLVTSSGFHQTVSQLGEEQRTSTIPIWTSFHDLLFNGGVDDVTRRRKSLFSNTLVLPGFDALEAAKIEDPKNSIPSSIL
jgi:hypothetical protein